MERSSEARANEHSYPLPGRWSTDVAELAALIAAVFRLDPGDSQQIASVVYTPEVDAAA